MKSAIFWYIAFENPSKTVEPGRNGETCGAGTQWRNVWWIRQGAPKRLLLLEAVTYDLYHFSQPHDYVRRQVN